MRGARFDVHGVELDADAVATHRKHVGTCDLADLTTYHPSKKHDVVGGGVPCFAAGTMVLTRDGYRPIEDIAKDTLVLTHLGRWRRVTATMSRPGAELLRVKAQGVPGVITTDEHPFLARPRTKRYDELTKSLYRDFGASAWTKAGRLTRGHYLAQVLPGIEPDEHPVEFWWLVGRYLADGWIIDSRRHSKIPQGHRGSRVNSRVHRIVICCAHDEESELAAAIERAGFRTGSRSRERTVVKFHLFSAAFVAFLRPFGRYAHGKTLPGFALALEPTRAAALLDGYLSGDGHHRKVGRTLRQEIDTVGTVSKSLALGMALLTQRARGVVATINFYHRPPRTLIEGREVNQRDTWSVVIAGHNRSAMVEGEYGWKLVRSVEPCGVGTVYNLSVEEDESYCADGAVVHNCQSYSPAGKRGGTADPRGQLYRHLLRVAKEASARCCFLENSPGILTTRGPDGRTAIDEIEAAFAREGWHTTRAVLNAANYGVPQLRRRVFLVGFRARADLARFRWPVPTHAGPDDPLGLMAGRAPWVTVRQALGLGGGAYATGRLDGATGWQGMRGLDVDAPGYAVGTRNNADKIAPLDSVLDEPARTVSAGGTEGGGGVEAFAWSGYRRRLTAALETSGLLDRPSNTIDTTNGVHPVGHARIRPAVRLTLEQLAALQGFPADWTFVGATSASRHRQVGNAVPPALAAALGHSIRAALFPRR